MKSQKTILCSTFLGILLLCASPLLRAQLYINEFMASNASTVEDPDYHENSDWVEIYNDYPYTINLSGFYLTDNLNNPDKWRIEGTFNIPSKDYIIIWCDGRDSALHTSFKLAQEGEEIGLFTPALSPIDTLSYIYQSSNVSYGRIPGNFSEWAYFDEATPGSENNTTPYIDRVENEVEFSLFGGLYTSPLEVELSTYLGGKIYYTLDGSEPGSSSLVYIDPIGVDETTIIRARVFKPNMIPGKVRTQSYFIDESLFERKLPIISIATDPDNFWDPDSGIYVQDYKPEWEIPVNIELFENNGSDRSAFSELAGVRVNGLYSWQLPQKMLGVYFRKEYDKNRLEYPLIHDQKRTRYKSFALRASGSDWSYTLLRDGMIQTASQLNSDVDIQGFRPCIVFVNGEYLGIHNIREKVNDSYIEGNHGLQEGTFDLVENEEYAESGDLEAYLEFMELLNRDLSVQSNYKAVVEQMDIENFTDYVSTEIYCQNTSVDHNVMAWRKKESGQWRWILMDLDRGFFDPTSNMVGFYINREVLPLEELLQNDFYKEYFGKRLADHLYTSFNPIRMHAHIDHYAKMIEHEIPYHVERWLGTTSSYGNAMPSVDYWYNEIDDLHEFADARNEYLLADLTDYGFDQAVNLSLDVIPPDAGYIKFNNLLVPGSRWSGGYPGNLEINLEAVDAPGYDFQGWAETTHETIVSRQDTWRFLDDGSDQGTGWTTTGFDDSSWDQGSGEFGYGDDDEETLISYGPNSEAKYITTYFRHSFNLTTEQADADTCIINLLRDDGAVVYLNGEEVIRSNMRSGSIDYQTTAMSGVSGSGESIYHRYMIDPSSLQAGENVVSVEVHQRSQTSSDMSFDLELHLFYENTSHLISSSPSLNISLSNYQHLSAVYERNEECILPDTISSDLTLQRDCSPYVTQGDVVIPSSVTLIVEPGVEIRMAENSNMFIHGRLLANGTSDNRIQFSLNPDHEGGSWGALCFHNSPVKSELSFVTIRDASRGPDPTIDVAAISAYYADLDLDNLIIDQVFDNPIAARYSDISLTNSQLHSKAIGDLVNIKYGHGFIDNCIFKGNNQPDTDAIDYDDIQSGVIRNCRIEDFFGFNSDAIDIGEKASDISIEDVFIYNITDKGISVGQQSSATVFRSVFINCNLGIGLKDSCNVRVDQCTFYGNRIPVSCYEKNPGWAGGNALVSNSILSNSYAHSFFADEKSVLELEFCISDNSPPPSAVENLFDDPQFIAPDYADFEFHLTSPCLSGGYSGGHTIDMGAPQFRYKKSPDLVISSLFYNPLNDFSKSEFLTVMNPGNKIIDLYGYSLTQAIDYTFTDHLLLYPHEKIFLVKDISNPAGIYYNSRAIEWTDGSLANEGEVIQLVHPSGIIIDQVSYSPDPPWPDVVPPNQEVITIIEPGRDNHFGYNWTALPYTGVFDAINSYPKSVLHIFPNPSDGIISVRYQPDQNKILAVYSLTGEFIRSHLLDGTGEITLDLNYLVDGVYLLKSGDYVGKICISR